MNQTEKDALVLKEIAHENDMSTMGIDRYRMNTKRMTESGSEDLLQPMQKLLVATIKPMEDALNEIFAEKSKARNKGSIISTLMLLKTDEIAILTAKSILSTISSKKNFTSKARDLGSLIAEQINMNKLSKHKRDIISNKTLRKEVRKDTLHKMVDSDKLNKFVLESEETYTLGSFLIELFANVTGVIRLDKENVGAKTHRVVTFSDLAKSKIEKAHHYNELMSPLFLPMIKEPLDWTSWADGGYEVKRLNIVKTNNKGYLEDELNMPKKSVFDAINNLQKTKWQINSKVLNVLEQLWESNSTLADLPSRNDLPPPKHPFDKEVHGTWESFSADKKNISNFKKFKEAMKDNIRENARLFSKRYLHARLVELGRRLENKDLYYVWRMDWRGRLYPEGQVLTPQGTGVSKALLRFAEGKKINERGVYWLKINLANTFGMDKVSFEDRIKWVEEHEHMISLCAQDPLTFLAWTEADEPWLFLASCFEYEGFLKNGFNHVTHLPINVDGSCNGLQHLSAILLDPVGAEATNLVDSEKPNDIYAQVAAKVSKRVDDDRRKDSANEYALAWQGKVTRKIVKRNVMTVSYGATSFGMLEQLREDLEKDKKDVKEFLDVDKEESLFPYYQYCSKYIQEAIDDTVQSAPKVMGFLQEVATIAGANNLPVYWETPNGFLVNQAYTKKKIKRLDTLVGSIRVTLQIGKDTKEIDKNKAALAIAPNFIHSLDAAHCQRSINRCFNSGLKSLAMIHDSYGTLANDVDELNFFLRDEFVKMYSEKNILEDFVEQIKKQLPEELTKKIPAIPTFGTFDLNNIYKSKYFFA